MASIRDFVNVPVPVDYVTAVMRFIAELDGTEAVGAGAERTDTPSKRGVSMPQLTTTFSSALEQSPAILQKAIHYLAHRPDEWVPMSHLLAEIGEPESSRRLGGALSGLSRKLNGEPWPFAQRKNASSRQSEYLMPRYIAERLQDTSGTGKVRRWTGARNDS